MTLISYSADRLCLATHAYIKRHTVLPVQPGYNAVPVMGNCQVHQHQVNVHRYSGFAMVLLESICAPGILFSISGFRRSRRFRFNMDVYVLCMANCEGEKSYQG